MALETKRHLHVLGVICRFEDTHSLKNFLAIQREGSRRNELRVKNTEYAPEKGAQSILGILYSLDGFFSVVDANARRYRHNLFVFKRGNKLRECGGLRVGVGVEASDNVTSGLCNSCIKRGVLAAVFFVNDSYVLVRIELLGNTRGAIRTSVVDDDDFKL